MKRACLSFFLLIALLHALCVPAFAVEVWEPQVQSRAAILMDADTGQILYQRNIHERHAPASITKIMTALLVCEHALPGEVMTVTQAAIDINEPDSSNIKLKAGEELTVRDGLYALMLPSANDAANVLAEYIAGSPEEFARLMTRRAQEIGATSTSFANPHGLDEAGHYTTAYDMALITLEAMENDAFAEYFGAREYTMPATNLSDEREFYNYQRMLLPEDERFYYSAVVGGKVGFTDDAQHTMSTVAAKDGRTLVCVVLYGENSVVKFNDTKELLDFGFAHSSYTFNGDDVPDFAVSVDGAGEAYFRWDGEAVFLLPEGMDKGGVRISYSHPKAFEHAEDAVSRIVFSYADKKAWMPDVLMEAEVPGQLRMSGYERKEAGAGLLGPTATGSPSATFLLFGIAMALFCIAIARPSK